MPLAICITKMLTNHQFTVNEMNLIFFYFSKKNNEDILTEKVINLYRIRTGSS